MPFISKYYVFTFLQKLKLEEEMLQGIEGPSSTKSGEEEVGKCPLNYQIINRYVDSSRTDMKPIKFKSKEVERKRVTIYMHSERTQSTTRKNGKLIALPSSLEELFLVAGQCFELLSKVTKR
jgi:KHA, dimerisation domain of potassium ion channel